jgi:hypothetical protein
MILADSTVVARRTKTHNCPKGASLMHPQTINKYMMSAHAFPSCTMLMGKQLGCALVCPEDLGRFYGRDKTALDRSKHRFFQKIRSRGGSPWDWDVVMKWMDNALGCPEWVPPGAGSQEGVLGTWWWFLCPSGPIHAIHADTFTNIDIHAYTYKYHHMIPCIPSHTCMSH